MLIGKAILPKFLVFTCLRIFCKSDIFQLFELFRALPLLIPNKIIL